MEKASLLEKILLGWAAWSFLAIVGNAIVEGGGGIVLYPIVFIASLFGDAQASIVGGFMSFGVSLGLIAGGIMHSMRTRRNKKATTA
ncbi:MAG: hypothetical protein WAZ27_00955 [Minisyncoccia bacterium]